MDTIRTIILVVLVVGLWSCVFHKQVSHMVDDIVDMIDNTGGGNNDVEP